ncbi:PLP-dependent aminotransferase family protein [Pseudochrobactrum sp. Wa41.01b-1]|uniref:MocR-like pyridoxine biosynthesis transcription factor PdxR n=1 Tax=Pseudochrobactrum sp. Wa41.01b-1 TaxID=2864102 RepID=UPI001C68BD86|nr:PLP-dependent aminotransferase family protein [Pseudochrobactrum sp. Wa41.01b-1]QYM72350.1 PLP-dependent aminotransferase family protein [Pseudochrobactrum sp. Wa41.01b-1]
MRKSTALAIEVSAREREPIFLALARSIIGEIERGRLKPGAALPGTRSLAQTLKLNRNTVDAAYHELTMQGWLSAEPSRGTFVSHDLPDVSGSGKTTPAGKQPSPVNSNLPLFTLKFSDGAPDARLLPTTAFAQAFRRALTSTNFTHGGSYSDPAGNKSLRENLSAYLNVERGLVATEKDILITRGSQMALFLAAKAIIEPGTKIAVEQPGYPLAWSAFRAAGAEICGIAVDEGGIDVDALEALARQDPQLKAVYLTPHHQYPTTVTLGAARRLRLFDIAQRYGLVIIEDDYDNEYRYDGRPVLPLTARSGKELPVIYLGSLSKVLAPGIRIGYAVAPADILKRMIRHREAIDRQGDLPLELALSDLLADGTIKRHARKARRIYHARRDFLAGQLQNLLGDDGQFSLPAGGLAIWFRLNQGFCAQTWSENAARSGLSVLPGAHFELDKSRATQAFRIGFANSSEAELARMVQILARSKA